MSRIRNCHICGEKTLLNGVSTIINKQSITMCGSCLSHIQEIKPEKVYDRRHDQLIDALRGTIDIVINACYGGYSLSFEAKKKYLTSMGVKFSTEPVGDRNHITAYGPTIFLEDRTPFYDDDIDRDDPLLVRIVREMGKEANGPFAELRIVTIPADVIWSVQQYDGREWISEQHRIWR